MQSGDLVAQVVVVVGELTDALVGQGEPVAQGGVRASLDRCRWRVERPAAEGVDLLAEFGFGIDPGAGDAGLGGDCGDGDGAAAVLEFPQRLVGSVQCLLATSPGGGGQVVGVVS